MSRAAAFLADPPATDDRPSFETIHKHGHQDLVQAVAFNGHGDRCATGSVDGKIRVFNRHKDGVWRLCDTWGAHASEILELQWLPTTIYPNLLASLGIEGRFKLWAEDPSAASGRRFAESTRNGPLVTIPSRSPYLGPNGTGNAAPATGIGSPMPAPASSSFDGNTPASGAAATAKPAFETRNSRSPYRSFSLKHLDDSRTTYLALLSADGGLTVYENDRIENLAAFTLLDELSTIPTSTTTSTTSTTTAAAAAASATTTTTGANPTITAASATTEGGSGAGGTAPRRITRGEETSFRVRFDPNPEVCYTALRAGVPSDALGLAVAVMDRVRVYRTRDTIRASLGVAAASKAFYLAAEVVAGVHRGLVRDLAWAPGNIRGYDIIATACQDGCVRVFRLDALPPPSPASSGEGGEEDGGGEEEPGGGSGGGGGGGKWSADKVKKHGSGVRRRGDGEDGGGSHASRASSGIRAGLDQSRGNPDRRATGLPGHIRHVMTEISRLDCHRTPVWRVGFDDDGQILGSVGDEGKLMCYRQKPDGTWAKSTEMAMIKMKMAAP
ncbi:WD40-repeat-containing domain protein [Thermothelomyces heterothallicus CBS 202.75]|uniref:WD40-repeat-containing domain protein n=1 Tax=Thermothelomyces heterothallicus CBS 202.75 TaxID=1149848 RepID=UPI003742D732